MPRKTRWHPSEEKDELVFAVCKRFLDQLGRQSDSQAAGEGGKKGAAAAVAEWLQEKKRRKDLTREKVYPFFREAVRRGFLVLRPPRNEDLTQRIRDTYHIGHSAGDDRSVQVIDVIRDEAIQHVTSAGADVVLSLVEKIGRKKQPVHIGLGGGYSAMMVARALASKVRSEPKCPSLVLHALSAGGFLVDKPQRSPMTYFSYFDDALTDVEFVGLFSPTVASYEDYDLVKDTPGVQDAFERAREIDIVVTSFARAQDEHGMLRQLIAYLTRKGRLPPDTIQDALAEGWVGDVQFRPFDSEGPMLGRSPARAVTLFELEDLVKMAKTDGKYVVLLARPCGECGQLKTEALRPLLTKPKLQLWTHLVLDVDTAGALLRSPPAGDTADCGE
ncbi:sugar-binding domain-containing protein [Planctomycetota bacterium]